jgi:Na+/H+ antiporter NhaD/arsenite permease-like protein
MHEVNPIWFIPFATLLLAIALMPFINAHWWERHYPKVSVGLGLLTLGYYFFWVRNYERIGHTAAEYVGFIALVGSLFVVAGGIIIRTQGEARPIDNVLLLAVGAIVANVIGTAGASILLIRPFIRMNKYRITAFHIVFFIFIVSNVAGCLTPIGDPPLFLGYLKGIPFFWVAEHLWMIWLVGVGWLLALFFAFDLINYRRAPREVSKQQTATRKWRVEGVRNIWFLAAILAAVFISKPPFVRELIMVLAAIGGYLLTRIQLPHVHEENQFNFAPLREVAWLFVGIFATMMPVLDWLEHNSTKLGIESVASFYWGTGVLSSVLDNAPTYLNFLSAAVGLLVDPQHVQMVQIWIDSGMTSSLVGQPEQVLNTIAALKHYHMGLLQSGHVPVSDIHVCYLIGNHQFNQYIVAISVGAVFFGAMTYIGNAPNFMVRTIAQHQKVEVPSFFGYLFKYALPIMAPLLLLVWWVFFRS